MKKILLVLMVASTAFMGCGKKQDGRAPISQRNGVRTGGISGQPGQADAMLDGQIFKYDSFTNSQFESDVRGYLSAAIPSSYVGSVNGDYYNTSTNTGLFFGAKVRLSNGTSGTVLPDSTFLTVVYDSYTGQKDEQGNVIPAIPTYLSQASGSMSGNILNAQFTDEYGTLILKGTVNGSTILGEVKYQNSRNADGGSPASGYLGWFQTNVCNVIVCN